jgi:hypothetical protein
VHTHVWKGSACGLRDVRTKWYSPDSEIHSRSWFPPGVQTVFGSAFPSPVGVLGT